MKLLTLFLPLVFLVGIVFCQTSKKTTQIIESGNSETIEEILPIDKVWAGHPVGFCLLTKENLQLIAYYNADRRMVVGQRNLTDKEFSLHVMPATTRETARGTSTVLGWDSHNSVTFELDKEGFIHLAANMHVHPLTYFRSTKPYDISTLEQVFTMVGTEENRCTYPKFMQTREGELLFHYRDGASGSGNEIYNAWSCETKQWTRLLDKPLTDGQGLMNAYQTQPTLMKDNWYHVYWVWRDTPDCSTNHDLSYMKSPDLKNWFNAFGEPIQLPATLDNKLLIVAPVPPKGGIINLSARLCLDKKNRPLFVYHKYSEDGNLNLYLASLSGNKWVHKQITDWDYRWEFSGGGSINFEVQLKGFKQHTDDMFEIGYWHIKYGDGKILLDKNLKPIEVVVKKAETISKSFKIEGTFPGLQVQTSGDAGKSPSPNLRYMLKWETLSANRDRPRPEPWPEASNLYLVKILFKGE